MNVIQHAYRGDSTRPIRLRVAVDDEEVDVKRRDLATPIGLVEMRGRSLEELRPGRLGVSFITHLMQDVCDSFPTPPATICV